METILSVGVDVGTTTTQVVFSRLVLQDTAGYFSVPRVTIVETEILYLGTPCYTPLRDASTIDAAAVKDMVLAEYRKAGIRPEQVSAGAVIITGESARKDNAAALTQSLSGVAGAFVVAAAGPDLESVIAGKGSGACAWSEAHQCRVINLDIGGGTTNAALFHRGETVATGCLDVGGRLVRTEADGTVMGFSPAAKRTADSGDIPLYIGMQDVSALKALCAVMTELQAQQAGLAPRTALYRALRTPHSGDFDFSPGADVLCLSGGVADTVRSRFSEADVFRYGDIGVLLGQAIARNPVLGSLPGIPAAATLRATVIGAGSYTTTVSGSTISAAAGALPLRNLTVYRCTEEEQELLFSGEAVRFLPSFRHALSLRGDRAAIALRGRDNPSYNDLKRLADSLAAVAEACLPPELPLVVISQADMAKALGQCLRTRTKRPVVSIDAVAVQAQDYIDIGKPVMDGLVVPVVVKTLLFGQSINNEVKHGTENHGKAPNLFFS